MKFAFGKRRARVYDVHILLPRPRATPKKHGIPESTKKHGIQESSSVLIYDIDADSWVTGPSLPRATYGVRAAALNGEVHVISSGSHRVYRGDAWVNAPGGPDSHYAVCGSVLLG
mgnify:CR=1 FL=1